MSAHETPQAITEGTPTGLPDDAPAPPTPEVKPEKSAATPNVVTNDYSGLIGGLVWLVILGFIGGYWLLKPGEQAQIFLQATSEPALRVDGLVLSNGVPVNSGTVRVVFEDPKKNRYLGGAILSIGEGGKFTAGNMAPDSLATPANTTVPARTPGPAETTTSSPAPLRITATYTGQQQKDKAMGGTASLYLNYPPPVGRWAIWTVVVLCASIAIGLITLFTGDLTRRKSRILFSITYIMTFMSLAVPIGAIVLVSKSQYAVEMMEEAPVGLIKGTARGIQNPQWLVNLGGAVSPRQPASDKSTPGPTQNADGNGPAPAPSPAASASPRPTPASTANPRADELRPVPGYPSVQGGLAVPFYVLILAMLGAGINMTKKVPDIQKRHDIEALPDDSQSMVSAALKAPVTALVSSRPRVNTEEGTVAVSGIRKDLIDTYMGLISAPFLAIAVYYLLQVIATNIAEPVLVLVAFATGFISDSIVTAITQLASEMINKRPSTPPRSGTKKRPPQAVSAGARAKVTK
jgi:hypothetical protein